MSYDDTVGALAGDAEQLEEVYRAAIEAGEAGAFKRAIDDRYASAPENLLYAAWFHRLKRAAVQAKGHVIAWAWVIPLAVANGLVFWWLSDDRYMITTKGYGGVERSVMPAVILWVASISAVFVLIYLTAVGRKRWVLSTVIGAILLAAGSYVFLTYPQAGPVPYQRQYLTLMAMHLPLLAWAGLGAFLVARHRDATNRFTFLIKSLEVCILGGLFVIAGGLFTAISTGLFDALDIRFPEVVQRLFVAGGGGLIPVVAVAMIYDPRVAPARQDFGQGLSRLVALLMRVLLPLTLLVLLVYVAFIPFNLRAPFDNRDVLIIYNGMLFAVVALLVGATPVSLVDVSSDQARWLRRGIVAVVTLALIVSLYALAAILYRTAIDRLTPNRLAFIGWNLVNIGLLVLVLIFQARAREGRWVQGLHRAYSAGTVAYIVWTLAMILVLPWLFTVDQGALEELPGAVQQIVHDHPSPILLKCHGGPHIYFLEKGQKRWIDSISTFEDRGYSWRDVHLITCDELRRVPDGVPIPADAGPPPQP